MEGRRVLALMLAALIASTISSALADAVPVPYPALALGLAGGPLGVAIAGGVTIGGIVVVAYGPQIASTIGELLQSIIKPGIGPGQGTLKQPPKPNTDMRPANPLDSRPKSVEDVMKRAGTRGGMIDNTPKSAKEARKAAEQATQRLTQQRRDRSDSACLRLMRKKGYRRVPGRHEIMYSYYKSQILKYLDSLRGRLGRIGFTEDQINEAYTYIMKQSKRIPDFKAYKDGKYYYIETKPGSGSNIGHDLAEAVLDSWFRRNLGLRIIWHFEEIGGKLKIYRLVKELGFPVWIGG